MDLRAKVSALMAEARQDLADLVSLKSVADPLISPPEECERTARWVLHKLAELGFSDARLEKTPDGSSAVVGFKRSSNRQAPTVLLYTHYDVQPALGDNAWRTPPFELTEIDGRWYGRGAADCKGNIVAHLVALRALGDVMPVNLKVVVEGSEEQGTGGLEQLVATRPELLRAEAILVCDTGNAAVGRPAATISLRGMVNVVVGVSALRTELHSGMFGGAAPDALAALIAMLASLRDGRGNTVIAGLDNTQTWGGEAYPASEFRSDAEPLSGVALLGDGTVADMLWARPAVTVLGIDCPPVKGSAAAISPRAAARLNLRIPPGQTPAVALDALTKHLRAAAPWGVHVDVEVEATGSPFEASADGVAFRALAGAMFEAYGEPMSTLGQGGSIPLCNVFAETYPDAEIILMGVEEPLARIHAPNESVDPKEIEGVALTIALFLGRYATALA